jgi:hypothetical protein
MLAFVHAYRTLAGKAEMPPSDAAMMARAA